MKLTHTTPIGGWILVLSVAVLPAAEAQWIPTNFGNGADAEVREAFPDTSFGTSTELATRVLDTGPGEPNDRNSLVYLKYDLSGLTPSSNLDSALRFTYRNNNLSGPRIEDTVTPDPTVRTGLAIYGLDPLAAGANWLETTITYNNAPGITPDGEIGTRDLNGDLTFLGNVLFPPIGTQNWLPVGGALVFQSPALDQFIEDALEVATEVTVVAHVIHDGAAPFATWLNFNYLFNPKEQTTLNMDSDYDADVSDGGNPLGSPWSGADNSAGDFSPSLLIQEGQSLAEVPAVGTVSLLLLVGALAVVGFLALRRLV